MEFIVKSDSIESDFYPSIQMNILATKQFE